jgi:hypothetical protein
VYIETKFGEDISFTNLIYQNNIIIFFFKSNYNEETILLLLLLLQIMNVKF